MELFGENKQGFNMLTISAEKPHRRCSTRLQMYLRLKVLLMWSVGGLQVYGIYCRNEVVEARLEIPLVVIRLGVTGLKKTGLVYLLDLFGRMGEEEWCDLVSV